MSLTRRQVLTAAAAGATLAAVAKCEDRREAEQKEKNETPRSEDAPKSGTTR